MFHQKSSWSMPGTGFRPFKPVLEEILNNMMCCLQSPNGNLFVPL